MDKIIRVTTIPLSLDVLIKAESKIKLYRNK